LTFQPSWITSVGYNFFQEAPVASIEIFHDKMAGASNKRQKREEYKSAHREDASTELPKKKFYRQRAHANPFSDHQLK
jgi:hypothetical protein